MAPKNEKAALKKAEKARNLEIAKRTEQERLMREYMEVVRLELEAKLAYEVEQAWLKLERERLAEEVESMKPMFEKHHEALRKLEAAEQEKKEWELYMDTSGFPQASKEATINNFLEVGFNTLDLDCNQLLKSLADIYKSAGEAEVLALLEDQKRDAKQAAKYRGFMKSLEKLGYYKLDQTTKHLLQKSHSLFRDLDITVMSGRLGDWKIAIWVNHIKNPRFRRLELPELDIFINLPKSFALANAAIRIVHQSVNRLYKSKNAYMALGGVLAIDVLGIPVEAKVVQKWTLQNPTSAELQFLGYPIPAPGQTAPTAQQLQKILPFEINILLPSFLVHWNPNPEIGWWDMTTETWQTEGIAEISYNHETCRVTFQTIKAKPHAVIQRRVREYPYKSWNCRPTSECTASLTLKTAITDVEFTVGCGWCQLVQPNIPVLADLLTQQLPPKILLQQLSLRGLQVMPDNDDAQYCGVNVKDTELEIMACRDTALVIPAFALASSSLNSTKDANHILVRILEIPEFLYPPTLEKSKLVKTVNYLHKGCALINHSHKLPDYVEKVEEVLTNEYATYNASLLVALRGNCLSSSQEKMESEHVAFTNTVNALMRALRLFSFGP